MIAAPGAPAGPGLTAGDGEAMIVATAQARGDADMSHAKVESVRASSSGTVGRAVSHARGQRLTLDSSSRPQADALTNSEAFLAGIASCGVTLIEMHAQETGVPVQHMEVAIEGVRTAEDPARFASVAMRFTIAGVDQAGAERLVETYRNR